MNADEFLKTVTPARPRSRLAPYWGDILKLREHGYTLEQVCQFLAANQVQISVGGLAQYIRRQEAKGLLKSVPDEKPLSEIPKGAPEEARKITNPATLREVRKREINLDDYLNTEGD